MKKQPTPIETKVERMSGGLAIVKLAFEKKDAEACRRCDLCRAKPGPTRGRVECVNTMPAAAVEGFVWGSASRLERAAAPAPAAAEETAPARPRRSRRRGRKAIDDIAADQLAAMAEERAADESDEDDGDDAIARRQRRTLDTTHRLEKAVLGAHPDFDEDGCEAVGLETEGHYVITISAEAVMLLGSDGTLTIAVPKSKIPKAAEVEAG